MVFARDGLTVVSRSILVHGRVCLGILIIRESFSCVDSSANNESPIQHPRIFLLFWVHLGQAGLDPKPEIMVPVVSTAKELRLIVPRIEAAVADELKKANVEVGQVLRVRCSRICVYEYVVFGLDARYYCEGFKAAVINELRLVCDCTISQSVIPVVCDGFFLHTIGTHKSSVSAPAPPCKVRRLLLFCCC